MSIVDKRYVVTMPDGSKWSVRVKDIAKSHAEYYAKVDKIDIDQSMHNTIELFENEYEIEDWARNNMDWSDVEAELEMSPPCDETDYQEGWANGDVEIVR